MDSDEALEATIEWLRTHDPFANQNEYGDDLSFIRENLKLTPTERLMKYQRAAHLALEVYRAGRQAGLHHGD